MKKKHFLNAVLLGVGLILFYLFISHIGFKEIAQTLKSAKLFFCFAGVFAYLCAIVVRSRKWFFWIRAIRRDLRYREILPFFLVNLLIGNITPFKSGEVATPVFLKKFFKISVGRGFSIIVLDRFSELVVFMSILIWAVFYLISRGLPYNFIFELFLVFFSFLSIFLFLLLCIIFFQNSTLKIIRKLISGKIFKKLAIFLEKEILYLYEGINLAKKERIYAKIFFLTVVGWVFDFLAFYFVFLSVSRPYFFDIAASQVLSAAVSFVAFIPNGIGVVEIGVTSLLNLMGYPLVQMAGAMVLMRIFLMGTLILAGIAGFYFMKEKQSKF